MKKSKNGFVLISVLLITTISSIYALSEIKGNQLQERIGGNQQKEINARLLAEKGMFESFKFMAGKASSAISSVALNNNIQTIISTTAVQGAILIEDFQPPVNDKYIFTSKGMYQGAVAYMKAEIEVKEAGVFPTPPTAVVGCEGVTVINSGHINSFDTDFYDFNNPSLETNKADISTVREGANIDFSGNVYIGGDVSATGRINSLAGSTANVTGNLAANDGTTLNTGTITGNIATGGDLGLAETTVTGDVSAVENLTHTQSASVGGNVKAATYTPPYLDYAGELKTKATGAVAGTSPNVAVEECDKYKVVENIGVTSAAATAAITVNSHAVLTAMGNSRSGSGLRLEIGESQAQFYKDDSNVASTVNAENLMVKGKSKKVYIFDNLDLKSITMNITGDVTFLVRGTFSSLDQGGTLLMGDNKSSLTILAEGQVNIGGSSDFFSNKGVNVENEAPLTIDSSYNSEINGGAAAITLTGAAKSYAVINAPVGHVKAENGAAFIGAVRGKTVSSTGNGGILYDENLKKVKKKDPDQPASTKYMSAAYHYK